MVFDIFSTDMPAVASSPEGLLKLYVMDRFHKSYFCGAFHHEGELIGPEAFMTIPAYWQNLMDARVARRLYASKM
jgi:hypothetical protein